MMTSTGKSLEVFLLRCAAHTSLGTTGLALNPHISQCGSVTRGIHPKFPITACIATMHPPLPREVIHMSVFTYCNKTRRICFPAAIRTRGSKLKILVQVEIIPYIKNAATLRIRAYVHIWERYYWNISAVGSPWHIKVIYSQIGCETPIYDLCPFFFPVIDIKYCNGVLDCINYRSGAKSSNNLVWPQFSQFIVIVRHC